MEEIELLGTHEWSLSPWVGSTHSFFTLNAQTLIDTWIILGFLAIACIGIRLIIRHTNGIARYTIVSFVDFFNGLCEQTLGFVSFKHMSFIATLFIFIFLCNTCPIFPFLEEPTRDLNTTLALGIIAFFYIQYESIKNDGIWGYIKSYFQPFFLLFPLNVIGKLASIVSVSFRLFGNIFGGSLISQIYFGALSKWWVLEFLGIALGVNLVITGFFTLFEGALQAFVFTMLTLTYIALALQGEGH